MIDRKINSEREKLLRDFMKNMQFSLTSDSAAESAYCKVLQGYFADTLQEECETSFSFRVMSYHFKVEGKVQGNIIVIRTWDVVEHSDRLIKLSLSVNLNRIPLNDLDIAIREDGSVLMRDMPALQRGVSYPKEFSGLIRGLYCERLGKYVDDMDSAAEKEIKESFGWQ